MCDRVMRVRHDREDHGGVWVLSNDSAAEGVKTAENAGIL